MRSYDIKYCGLMSAILSRIVEVENAESGPHVARVSMLTELMLQQLVSSGEIKLSQRSIALTGAAAALHDIGKTAVPSAILNKPSRLTARETAIMPTHTTAGAAILDSLPAYQNEPFMRCARAICLCHHERWDGGGYPAGLSGDDIPLSAQVVAVADVYDALTSQRCYKEAIPHSKAMDMILSGKCGAFNPMLLGCFEALGDSLEEALSHAGVEHYVKVEIKS